MKSASASGPAATPPAVIQSPLPDPLPLPGFVEQPNSLSYSIGGPDMNDFRKALETLQTSDLSLLVAAPSPFHPGKRKCGNAAGRNRDAASTASATAATPSDSNANEDVKAHESNPPASMQPEHAGVDIDAASAPDDTKTLRKRRHVEHQWPAVGTILYGTYFGMTCRAEVAAAKKRLKSGKQLKLLDGPAQGRRFDSFTKAMMAATAKQRHECQLGRRGVANGWSFWRKEGGAAEAVK